MTTSTEDLPEEMLVKIFAHLELEDRKTAAAVCHRWSRLALRWTELQLVVDFRRPGEEDTIHRILLCSSRPYRHLVLYFGYDYAKCNLLLQILEKFSSTMDTLKLLPNNFVPVEIEFLANMLKFCSNLKRLHVDACTFQHHTDAEINFPPLNNLCDLYLENNLLDLPEIDFREVTPNITGLHLQISYYSKRPQQFLQHFCARLKELEVWFLTEDHFASVCGMNFPLLEKVNFYSVDSSFDDSRSLDSLAGFFQRCAKLKNVTLRCNANEHVLGRIAPFCSNLQCLCISIEELSEECFRYLSELRCLKRLRIEDAIIHAPDPGHCSPFKKLQMLSLYSVHIRDPKKFNTFASSLCPALAILELLHLCCGMNEATMFKFYSAICSNLLYLQRLVLHESEKLLDLDLFFYFASLSQLRELRLQFRGLTNYICTYESNLVFIRSLSIDVPSINDTCLLKLLELLPTVNRLHLSSVNDCSAEGIRQARERLPLCDISVKQRVRIEERLS
ncbi:uncharacterized protein LOC131440043 isoform X1 [Malaya genurostris]|uniref:uncharacterized protein LOC131440043 isoform X1 n=1 Tax=Malaya genurostris TaxID=325434 RepID=UPI0026F3FFCB|nr:uncharacterized protein LOC131440043 isoform X1 [Malaya genurostris]